jgi:hypothetical protein
MGLEQQKLMLLRMHKIIDESSEYKCKIAVVTSRYQLIVASACK